MARYLYLRVSTQKQSFEQQIQDIKAFGTDPENVDGIVEEHESGGKSFTDRKLQQLINRCKPGDTIYAASTDRLGRSFVDMVRLMEVAKQRGILIIACKQNLSLDDNNTMGKMVLAVYSIIDEDERKRIRHRVKNGVNAAIQQLAIKGKRKTKKGTEQTHWGNAKGCDMSKALAASCIAKQDAAAQWREQSAAYKMVRGWNAMGKSRNEMLAELQRLYEHAPEKFCTAKGQCVTRSVLDRWCREMNPLAI